MKFNNIWRFSRKLGTERNGTEIEACKYAKKQKEINKDARHRWEIDVAKNYVDFNVSPFKEKKNLSSIDLKS